MSDRVTIIQPGPLSVTAIGLRARLALVFPPARFAHEWMPARVTPAIWSRLTRRAPLVAIGFNGFSGHAMAHSIGHSSWSIYLATRNEAGDEARLFGDRLAPGLFGMLEVAIGALVGHQLPSGGSVMLEGASHAVVDGFDEGGLALATLDLIVPTAIDLSDILAGGDADAGSAGTADIEWNFAGADGASGTHTGTA